MVVDVSDRDVDDCREDRVGVFSESISDTASSARYASPTDDVDLATTRGAAVAELSKEIRQPRLVLGV